METLRILFYTDKSEISLDPTDTWSVADVKKFIEFKIGSLVRVEVQMLNRHIDQLTGKLVHGVNQLTRKLLDAYDELWVFGYGQTNLPQFGRDLCSLELYDEEVKILKEWMDCGGGLMLTGDHANTNPFAPGGDHSTFLNLGRALGYKIPRAGQLRVWEGAPTADIIPSAPPEEKDNFNTQEGDGVHHLDDLKLQSDGKTQTIHLEDPNAPHELFRWYEKADGTIVPILQFPDHMHEGRLVIPTQLDEQWPQNSDPPRVVAWGKDKRFVNGDRLYPLVVAYDGDDVQVGRIVADSSFHHYVKTNLARIPDRDLGGNPVRDSPLDQIAQFYGNLAYWLAPKVIRDKSRRSLLFRLARHPDVFEVQGSNAEVVSNAVRYALGLEIGRSNLKRLLASDDARGFDALLSLTLSGKSAGLSLSAEEYETLLASGVRLYHEAFSQQAIIDPGMLQEDPIPMHLVKERLGRTLEANRTLMNKLAAQSSEQLASLLHDPGYEGDAADL